MEVRTGSKSWGYSKIPKNWKRIMNEELDEDDPQVKYWLTHPLDPPEIEESSDISIEELEWLKTLEPPEIEDKPKITVTVISQPKPGETWRT